MNRTIRVLVVDDEKLLRDILRAQLSKRGFEASSATSGLEALDALRDADYDVVLLDLNMPGLSGLETLRRIRLAEDAPEVIVLTADCSLSTGIEAMQCGAYDYLTKPTPLDKVEAVIRKADEKRHLVRQNAGLGAAVGRESGEHAPEFIYASAAMKALLAQAEAAARHDSTIMITGESGTGKDVLTRFIHARSARAQSPLITVNCGALPESLFESEFFGHEKGAFTGANTLKRGLLDAADNATLFLDEVGEMPLTAQVKLLQFLENGRFRRIGSTRDQSADVRTITATNRNIERDVAEGRFRSDLFYRLNVVCLHILPLRERPEDIPELINYFLDINRRRFKRPALDLTAEARRRAEAHTWPGNVRELRNCLERAAALSISDLIDTTLFLPQTSPRLPKFKPRDVPDDAAPVMLCEMERQHILRVFEDTGGHRERTAAILGISMRTLYRKLREYETPAGDIQLAASKG